MHTCEKWLAERYAEQGAIPSVVKLANIPERTLKRRFKVATGSSLIERTQDLRVEEAKCLLEAGTMPVDEISFDVGALAK